MSMLDFDGSTKYVWNPYSLFQLKEMLGDFDTYLECVASRNDASCAALTPKNDIFEQQQMSLLSVYQRCLSNYQEMTWDQGTYVLFNQSLQAKLLLQMPLEIRDSFNVSKCLLEQRAKGYDNVGCLKDYFLINVFGPTFFFCMIHQSLLIWKQSWCASLISPKPCKQFKFHKVVSRLVVIILLIFVHFDG